MNILQSIAVIAAFFVAVFLLLFIPSLVQADNYHHHDTINISNTQEAKMQGTALSLAAAAHSFDWSTKDLQGSIGLGGYSGENALSFGIGKRYG
ncbi:MAG: hypothetical protein KAV87_68225, partial [Desulfobacteraceae bacterium]|nr:hypothetical protein [Desulfobacteraceae bacterium]